jgi:hypothetical protein
MTGRLGFRKCMPCAKKTGGDAYPQKWPKNSMMRWGASERAFAVKENSVYSTGEIHLRFGALLISCSYYVTSGAGEIHRSDEKMRGLSIRGEQFLASI